MMTRIQSLLTLAALLIVLSIASSASAADDALAPLIAILNSPAATTSEKGDACTKLMEMGPSAAAATPALVALLKSGDKLMRDYAITTLGKVGASDAVPALKAVAASDPDENLRSLAAEAATVVAARPALPASSATAPAAAAPGDPFAGKFVSAELTMTLRRDGDACGGTFRSGANEFPLSAKTEGKKISGAFIASGSTFTFEGSLGDDGLTVTTGGKTYLLKKEAAAPASPVAPPAAPLQPTAAPASASQTPQSPLQFQLINMIPSGGRTLYATLPGAKSAKGLLLQTRDYIAANLQAPPKVAGAFVDDKDARGGASFEGVYQGTPIKGLMFAGIGPAGGSATIAFDRAELAPQTLSGLLQRQSPAGAAAPQAPVQWQNVALPDGSGSMRLPMGWRITGAANGAADVAGPDGQGVELGLAFPVNTPEGEQAWIQSMAGAGMAPHPSGSLVVPYSADPVQAFQLFVPPYAAMMNRNYGSPLFRLTRIVEAAPTQFSTGQAAFIHYEGEMAVQGPGAHFKGMALVAPSVTSAGHWLMYFSYISAPDAIFNRDLGLMLQIWSSWKVSDAVLQQRLKQAADNMRSISEIISRPSPPSGGGGGDSNSSSIDKTNADFDEVIRGYRTVEDSTTGERKEVDLGNVNQIVDKMNEHEGYARYTQIPLRDQ